MHAVQSAERRSTSDDMDGAGHADGPMSLHFWIFNNIVVQVFEMLTSTDRHARATVDFTRRAAEA